MDCRRFKYLPSYTPGPSYRGDLQSSFKIPGRGATNVRGGRGNTNVGPIRGSTNTRLNRGVGYGSCVNQMPHFKRRGNYRDNRQFQESLHRSRESLNSDNNALTVHQNDNAQCRYYICPGCKNHYNYFKNCNILSGRVPRVLPCEHTICEDCINRSIKTKNQICCPTCSGNVMLKKQQILDYNHYILGQITCSRLNQSIDSSNVALVSTKTSSQGKTNDIFNGIVSEEICGLGACQKLGTVSCLDCSGVYCSTCDEALHKSGKILLSHKRNAIDKVRFELKKCGDHSMLEELYCDNCEISCCCYCFLEKHEGHTRSYLIRLSKEEEIELKESCATANKNIRQLEQTCMKLKKPDMAKVSNLELRIAEIFSNLHAKLHKIENKLLTEAKEISNDHSKLKELDRIVNSNIETLKYLVKCVEQRDEMKLDLRGLLKKLKEMERLPVCLVTENDTDTVSKLVVDDRLKELEKYFKIEIPCVESYKLVPIDEWRDNYVTEEVPTLGEDQEANHRLHTVTSVNECIKTVVAEKNGNKCESECKNNFEPEKVYITHINSLDCFYVQFKKEETQFNKLQRDIKNHVEKTELGVADVEINELYMAPCLSNKKQWGRVRVIKEIAGEGDTKYQVKFIDFGNTYTLEKNHLRYISSYLANRRPFAGQCRLYNPSKIEFGKDSHLKLAKLLHGNMEVIMFTKDFSNNIYTVELNVTSSLGDMHSVIELLIMGCPSFHKNSTLSLPSGIAPLGSNQLFSNSDTFTKGESYKVFIRYILNPCNIYVQKASYESSLTVLKESMKQYYKNSQCDIHLPVKDSDVVIQHPSKEYGNWHRARIQEVFNNEKIVNVFLVDWGKQVNVSWKNLRRLAERFRRTECLVVRARLADVGPLSGSDWSISGCEGARAFLEKYSSNSEPMKMLVSESDPLEVVLFQNSFTYDENINALLVEQQLALSTGKLSLTVKWFHKKEEDKPDENEFLPIYKDSSDEYESSEEDTTDARSQIEIVRFDDPYCIYATFLSETEESNRLMAELQVYYKQVIDVQDSWNVDDKVVVFDWKVKLYYRGRIQKIQNEKYYVYLLDRGDCIWVYRKNLRRISEYFSTAYPYMVHKCHLANIKPAGDSNKWSSISLEWFQKLFVKYKDLYFQKVSDDEVNQSIPVTMWYSKVIQGNALEPSCCKFVSIDKKVIRAGLAFRKTREDLTASSKMLEALEKIDVDKSTSPILKMEPSTEPEALELAAASSTEDGSSIPNSEVTEKPESGVQQELVVGCRISQWLPSIPLEATEFYAYITCAETEGYLFVRDQNLHALYKEMETNMKEHFDSIPKAKPFELRENQLLTIWSNGGWYRGILLSVIDKNTAKVMMVDYGSDHIVNIEHLHNKIMYPEVPVMTTKIKLHDVHPKAGRWSADDIDILLRSVSEYSKIVIRSSLSLDIPLADVYNPNGICLNDKIVQLSSNLYRSQSENKQKTNTTSSIKDNSESSEDTITENIITKSTMWSSIVEEANEENSVDEKDYIYAGLPPPFQKTEMNIVSVFDYRTVALYISNDPSKDNEFAALSKAMQDEASNLEPLEHFEIGRPCISLYQEDMKWYRAKIFKVDGLDTGYVTVLYVDYGNFDIVSVSNVKQPKPEWLHFPANCFVARVDYSLVNKQNEPYLLKHMEQLIGKSQLIEIVKECPLHIHIYGEKCDMFYYDVFLSNGTVKLLT